MVRTSYKSKEYVDDSDLEEPSSPEPSFEPPKHYHRVTKSTGLPKIKDKELWLIRTPKGFPIDKLKCLPIELAKNKKADSFEINGSSFEINEELSFVDSKHLATSTKEVNGNNKHAVFTAEKGRFIPTDHKFNRFYNIREVVDVPHIDFEKATVSRNNVPKIKKLRMRHFPTGYGQNDYDLTSGIAFGEEEGEEEEEEEEGEGEEKKDEEGEEGDILEGKVLKKAKIASTESSKQNKHKITTEKSDRKERKEKKHKKEKKDKSKSKSKKEKS
ncbi:RPA34 [Candida oxycetoniae]|uniref:RPA34 n=1 Tax=Candida oxycetoniae TaxID=497107 RepID=A0AAI9WXR9_9ASCO|nr:RPA34 [Candida oxycetoniae]KAI3404065.2 RPA34 [Candida oxycetoniae]